MNAAQNSLSIRVKDNVNTVLHTDPLDRDKQFTPENSCNTSYCTCGHKPSIIPVNKTVDGLKVERFVALCATCLPAGAMDLKEFKAPYLALLDFEDNSRVTNDNNNGETWYAS